MSLLEVYRSCQLESVLSWLSTENSMRSTKDNTSAVYSGCQLESVLTLLSTEDTTYTKDKQVYQKYTVVVNWNQRLTLPSNTEDIMALQTFMIYNQSVIS